MIPATATFKLTPSSKVSNSGLKAHPNNAKPVGNALPAKPLLIIYSKSLLLPAGTCKNNDIIAKIMKQPTVSAFR
ncbi:hypothetical protein B0A68_11030 [Flavobacterium reichenbachii]|uniref:Uncharacterized protein n=1 Tax=Flavobacterium reichenbachii TaxID=362418 RepID=A0A085ZFQ2_9FLAO|nr:hypothetical protein IW19_20420 [Flavobacterium reichenbachii]OXB15247.1 hypothetical protein B0A68_11030 [Flavobacterium reichenbachii]